MQRLMRNSNKSNLAILRASELNLETSHDLNETDNYFHQVKQDKI